MEARSRLQRHVRTAQLEGRTTELVLILGRSARHALLWFKASHASQRRTTEERLDASTRRHYSGNYAHRRRRIDVRHRTTQQRHRAGRPHWARGLEVHAPPRSGGEPLHGDDEPRRRRARRSRVRGDARHASGGTECEDRQRHLRRRAGRLSQRLVEHPRAPGHRRQDHRRRYRWRVRAYWLYRRLRCRHWQEALAHLHNSAKGRPQSQDLDS